MAFKKAVAICVLFTCLLGAYVTAADTMYGWKDAYAWIAVAGNTDFVYGTNKIAVRFKATYSSSALTEVHMFTGSTAGTNLPVYVMDIQTDSSGIPSGTSIATGTWTPSASGWSNVTISPTVTLTTGNIYHLVMYTLNGTGDASNRWCFMYVRGGPRKYYFNSTTLTTRDDEQVLQWKGTSWAPSTSWAMPEQAIPSYVLKYSDGTISGNVMGASPYPGAPVTVYGAQRTGYEITPSKNFVTKGVGLILTASGTGGARNCPNECFIKAIKASDSSVVFCKQLSYAALVNWQNGAFFSINYTPDYPPVVFSAGVKYYMYLYQGTSTTDITGTGDATHYYGLSASQGIYATTTTTPVSYKNLSNGAEHNINLTNTTTTGVSWISLPNIQPSVEFKMLDNPVVSGILPTSALNTSVVTVTVSGGNFAAGAAIQLTGASFSTINGTVLTIASPLADTMTCTFNIDGQAPGARNIAVTNVDGKLGVMTTGFTITAPAPAISTFTPASVNASAVSTLNITINGSNFFPGTTAKLRRQDAADVDIIGTNTVVATNKITADFQVGLNIHSPGIWKILVTSSVGVDSDYSTAATNFTINVDPPGVTSTSPSQISNTGTVQVTISGSQVCPSATVYLTNLSGKDINIPGTVVTILPPSTLIANFNFLNRAPASDWRVKLTNTDGSISTDAVNITVVAAAPVITSVNPQGGAIGSLATVTITGSNFFPGATTSLTAVTLAVINGTGVSINSATQMTATFALTAAGIQSGWRDLLITNNDSQTGLLSAGFGVGAPVVSAISPSTSTNTVNLTVTISGNYFQVGSTTNLSLAGQPSIGGTSVSVTSVTTISCAFDLTKKAPGNWDLIVTNPAPDTIFGTKVSALTITATAPSGLTTVPSSATNTGSLTVTVSGSNIYPGASIRMVKTSLTDITGTGTLVLTAGTSGAGASTVFDLTGKAPGTWDIILTNTDSKSATNTGGITVIAAGQITAGTITPNFGPNNQGNITVAVTGNYFYPGVTLKLTGASTINATSVSATSLTTLTASLPLTGTTASTYNVVLANTDSSKATIVNGFTITRAPELIRIIPSSAYVDENVDSKVEGVTFNTSASFKITCVTNGANILASYVTVYRASGATSLAQVLNVSGVSSVLINPLASGSGTAGFLADSNSYSTTSVTSVSTNSFNLSNTGSFWGGCTVRVDDEIMRVGQVYGGYQFQSLTRGISGSTAATHATNSGVFLVNAAYLREDIYPVATSIGLTFSNFTTGYDSLSKFSKAGVVKIGTDSLGYELVSYTDTLEDASGNTLRLTGCTRGAYGTTAGTYSTVVSNKVGVVEVGTIKIDSEVMLAETSTKNILKLWNGARGIYGSTAASHSNGAAIYSSSLMGAGFSTTGAPAGLWNVVVTNPDTLAATLTSGFTISVYSPTVTGVNPSTLENSGVKTLTINGTNFKPDALITLKKAGETDVIGTTTTVVTGSAGYVVCTVNLLNVAVGPWDVKETNVADAQSQTFSGGLLVTNATPVVSSISPSTGANTAVITVTLNGTFFRAGGLPAASLSKVGQPVDILGTSLTVLNSTTARCVFNLNGMGPGTWDVVYTHNDDSKTGRLAAGFTITSDSPILSDMQPSIAGSTGPATFTLTGTGFFPGLTTQLVKGSSVINGTGVAFVNKALSVSATASSTYGTQTPNLAVDGNGTTWWEARAGVSMPQWLKVDLGAAYSITKVVLNWDSISFGKNYTIDVSPDGINNWTTATSVVSFSAGGSVTHYLNSQPGYQFVRVNITTGSTNSTLKLNEFEVYTSNSLSCVFDLTSVAQGRWSPYVINSDGNSSYLTGALKVYGIPLVNTVNAAEGLNTASNTLTIVGDNYIGVTGVKFNDPASSAGTVISVNENQLIVTFPPVNNSGRFDPIISAIGGSNTSAAQHFDLLIPQNLGADQVVTFIDNTKVIVPSGTFNDDVALIISQTMSNPGLVATANNGIKGNLIKIYPAIANNIYELSLSKLGVSFNSGRAVTFKIKYNGINDPNIEKNLRIFELDTARGMWKLVSEDQAVDMVAKTVSVSLVHFSVYRLAYAGKYGSDLSDVESYPNPVSFDAAVNNTVKFVRLVANTNINIYTLSGELVLSLPAGTNNGKNYNDAANGVAEWDGTNTGGEKVVRGLYLVLFRDDAGHHVVKKVVVK